MTLTVREALLLVLDQVDYTKGACGLTEMVGACLDAKVIDKARAALAADQLHAVGRARTCPETEDECPTPGGCSATRCGRRA